MQERHFRVVLPRDSDRASQGAARLLSEVGRNENLSELGPHVRFPRAADVPPRIVQELAWLVSKSIPKDLARADVTVLKANIDAS